MDLPTSWRLLLFLHLLASPPPPPAAADSDSSAVVSRIAFGSCANQSAPQPIWDAINGFEPQLFIWLGDNVYGDNRRPFRVFGKERTIGPWKNVPRFFPSTEEELRRKYEMEKSKPGYARLRQRARVIGTWDDHDYGLNDAGKEFVGKNTSQRLLLDFLDESEDSPRRKQAGVYASYTFGPEGKQLKVILLDTRYHRDPLSSDGSILGETQWKWLEKELNDSNSQVTIIASSIQVISNLSAATGPLFYMESWGRFPKERKKLYELISNTKKKGVLFISGDVHFGEITRYDCGCEYPLYDITSSGLTQAVEKVIPGPLAFLVRALALLTPTTMRVFSSVCRYRSCTYGQPNFGAIEINWDDATPTVKLEVRDVNGVPVIGVDFLLTELQPKEMNATYKKRGSYQHHCSLEIDLPWIIRYQLAFLVFGAMSALIIVLVLFAYIIVSNSKKFKTD